MAEMIVETDKFQDLRGDLASWSPRGADGVVLERRLSGSRLKKSPGFSASLEAGKHL